MTASDDQKPWYHARNGEQYGPMTWAELQSRQDAGQIGKNDLLWCPDFTEWKAAAEIFPPKSQPPPPLPKRAAAPVATARQPAQQPVAPGVVQPTSDFQFDDKSQTLTYFARTNSKGRLLVMVLMIFPLVIVGCLSLVVGCMASTMQPMRPNDQTTAMIAFLVTVGCIVAAILMTKWANKPKVKPIVFDSRSISFDGNTYLLEHVTSIGWRSSGGYSAGGTGMQGAAMMAGAAVGFATSGQVHIQYGADEVPIITGLHPNNVEVVYSRIVTFLERFGHHYGN